MFFVVSPLSSSFQGGHLLGSVCCCTRAVVPVFVIGESGLTCVFVSISLCVPLFVCVILCVSLVHVLFVHLRDSSCVSGC